MGRMLVTILVAIGLVNGAYGQQTRLSIATGGTGGVWYPMGGAMDVLEGLGKDYPEGLWVSSRYWFLYPPTSVNQGFVQRFHKRWNRYPHYSSETSYSAYWAIKQACERAGSAETDKVIKALEDMTMISPGGRRWFRKEDHQAVYEVPWGRTKADPKYSFRILGDLRTVPAEMYYRHPPFTS